MQINCFKGMAKKGGGDDTVLKGLSNKQSSQIAVGQGQFCVKIVLSKTGLSRAMGSVVQPRVPNVEKITLLIHK
jgi:hypothetical protein